MTRQRQPREKEREEKEVCDLDGRKTFNNERKNRVIKIRIKYKDSG